MRRVLACLSVLLLAACGGGGEDRAVDIYGYENKALDLKDYGRANKDHPLNVRNIDFLGTTERVPGFLVKPPGEGPYPAVIYLHGQGGDRFELLQSAAWIAARRAIALTVESPYSPNRSIELGPGVEGLRRERDRTVQAVVELRRAVDLLQSLPEVDDEHIGFVGYSAGARLGALLAGVERRIDGFVLMSGGEDTVDEFMKLVSKEDEAAVRPLLEDTDGVRYIGQASPSKLFFQAGRKDTVVPKNALETLIRAGSEPKRVSWYQAGHSLAVPKAQRDQLDWLSEVLEIEGPPIEGAETGP